MRRVRERLFVGSGLFLSFVVGSPKKSYLRAKEIFESAERGECALVTNGVVVSEVLRALEADCGFTRREAARVADAILETRNLAVADRALVARACGIYGRGRMDFADAYAASFVAGQEEAGRGISIADVGGAPCGRGRRHD